MEQTPLPPLLTDFDIEQHSGGYLNKSNFPESVHKRRTEDLATGMRLARLFYEVNPGAINADRQRTREVVQALCDTLTYVTSRNFGDEHARILFYANGGKSPEKALSLAKSLLQIEPTKP